MRLGCGDLEEQVRRRQTRGKRSRVTCIRTRWKLLRMEAEQEGAVGRLWDLPPRRHSIPLETAREERCQPEGSSEGHLSLSQQVEGGEQGECQLPPEIEERVLCVQGQRVVVWVNMVRLAGEYYVYYATHVAHRHPWEYIETATQEACSRRNQRLPVVDFDAVIRPSLVRFFQGAGSQRTHPVHVSTWNQLFSIKSTVLYCEVTCRECK